MPEPVVVIGGAIALLMMLGGKKKKPPLADEPGNIPGGGSDDKTPVGDPDAGVKGGGTKRPGGGWDDSDYAPPNNLSPSDLWIAPDCRGVIEGEGFWANKLRPRALSVARNWNRDWAPGVNDILAVALGQFRFTNTPEPLFPPNALPSCLSDWPGWWWGTVYSRTATQLHTDRYNSDLAAYGQAFPALASYLEATKNRLLQDSEVFNALIDAQDYGRNTLYFTGVDEALVAAAGEHIMAIAGPRLHDFVDYERLLRYYPETFPGGEALLVFMRVPGTLQFQWATVPHELAGDLSNAAAAVDAVVNETGWFPPGAGS